MFPKKLQAIAVNFDRTPGVGLNELGKIKFSLFKCQLIRAAVKILTDSANGPGIGINGLVASDLILLGPWYTPFLYVPEIGQIRQYTLVLFFFLPRSGLVQRLA